LGAVVVLLSVIAVGAQNGNLTARTIFGIDTIEIDSPSWITKIEASYVEREILVFGERSLRPVLVTGESVQDFIALPTITKWAYDLLDLHTFFDNNTSPPARWTFGVTDYSVDEEIYFNNQRGAYLPLIAMKPPSTQWLQPSNDVFSGIDWTGKMFAGLRVDHRNMSDVQIFYAGWIVNHTNPNDTTTYGKQVSFATVRTHFNTTQQGGLNQARFNFDPEIDVAHHYREKFASFSSTYKPFVHIIPLIGFFNDTLIAVADPNTRSVYGGYFEDNGFQGRFEHRLSQYPGYDLVSTALGYDEALLYVGLATTGNASQGIIAVINLLSPAIPPAYYLLPQYASNPRALALDELNKILYIGLNGANEVLKWDAVTHQVVGYQRLPEYLHQTWSGFAAPVHIYFSTYEQQSKVFRVDKRDFCPSRCPYWGYCSRGTCTCSDYFELSADKTTCELKALVDKNRDFNEAHGGEIALGVLFTLTSILAGVGWFLWYRGRRAGYAPV